MSAAGISTAPNHPFSVNTKAEAEELRPSSRPLSLLTKAEASEWLRSLGEEPRVTWTSVEIKSRIKDIMDFLATEDGKKLPKNMTGMKKADLQRECTERNINFTEHETKGSMMRKIREAAEAGKGGKGGSLMGFGKLSDWTYEEVVENHPVYVKWAQETAQEGGPACHARLRKFVTWLNNEAAEKDKGAEKASTAKPKCVRRVKRAATTEKDTDDMKAEIPLMEENPTPKNRVEEQILGALEKLDKRMSSLEAKQAPSNASASWQNLSSDGGAPRNERSQELHRIPGQRDGRHDGKPGRSKRHRVGRPVHVQKNLVDGSLLSTRIDS